MYWVLFEIFLKKEEVPFDSNFYVNCLFFSGPLPPTPGELITSQLKSQAYITRYPLAAQLLCFNFMYHITAKSALEMQRL